MRLYNALFQCLSTARGIDVNDVTGDPDKVDSVGNDVVSNEFSDDTVVLEDIADDVVGDASAELDVSRLVAKLDSTDDADAEHKREIHRRLEELNDQKEKEKNIDSTFNFNLDDDL
jgi:hypothetical protein